MAKFAVCIGINDYPGASSDLHGCVNDALDWQKALRARGFESEVLLDSQATGDAIRDSLARLVARVERGDVVIVTFSGHGSFVPDKDGDEDDGLDECWCPFDVMSKGPIVDDEMNDIYGALPEGVRWIVISDSCHSGTVTRFSPIDTPATTKIADAPQRLVRFLPPSVFSKQIERAYRGKKGMKIYKASPPGREDALLMSGCQDSEYSYDAWFEGRPNGAFTFVALRELANQDPDSTYEEWYERIRHSLPSQQYPQAPNLFGPKRMRNWIAFAAEGENASTIIQSDISGAARVSEQMIAESWDVGRSLARDAIAARGRKVRGERAPKTPLVAEGDSWFDFPFHDVLTCLEDEHDYDISSVARRGDTVEDMAYSQGQLGNFLRMIDKMVERREPPRAVLLSGGGNDVVGDEFAQLLNHSQSPHRGINDRLVEVIVNDRIRAGYATIIAAVTEICEDRLGERVPIVIHGYSYAVPDGRGVFNIGWLLPGPWLQPSFRRKGYSDQQEMQEIIDGLIRRLNEMQEALVESPGMEHVRHVNLLDAFPRDGDHRNWWQDELHPTKRGFRAVAQRFAQAIRG